MQPWREHRTSARGSCASTERCVSASPKPISVGSACTKTTECTTGSFGLSGKCSVAQCLTNGDCGAKRICTAGNSCQVGAGGSGLTITAVRGETDPTTVPAASNGTQAPAGFWTSQKFVVIGSGFDATVSAQLLQAGNKLADLTLSNASAEGTSFAAAVPATLLV